MNKETTYLQIGDNYRISRDDDRNILVEHFRLVSSKPNRYQKESKDVEKWVHVGFYSNVPQALKRILREELSQNLTGKVEDLIEIVGDTMTDITKAVEESGLSIQSMPKVSDGRGRKSVEVAKVSDKEEVAA